MFSFSTMGTNIGLLLIRTGLGCIFIVHGTPKIVGGTATWQWLGEQMANIGITFFPAFWGFTAAITMVCGGFFLALGLRVRIISALLAFTMLIALIMHLKKGDPFSIYAHALSLLCVFMGLFFTGGGKYSLDNHL